MEEQADRDGCEDDEVVFGVHHREGEEAPGAAQDGAGHVDRPAAEVVGHAADHRHHGEVDGVRHEQEQQDPGGVRLDDHLQVRDGEGDHEVVEDVLREPQAHGGEDAARVAAEDFADAVALVLDGDFLLGLQEDRGIRDLGPDVVADQDDHGGEPEGHAPAPAEEVGGGQRGGQREQHAGGEQVA